MAWADSSIGMLFLGPVACLVLELEIFLALRKSMIPGLVIPTLYFIAAVKTVVSCTVRAVSADILQEGLFFSAFPAIALFVAYIVCRIVRLFRWKPATASPKKRAGK